MLIHVAREARLEGIHLEAMLGSLSAAGHEERRVLLTGAVRTLSSVVTEFADNLRYASLWDSEMGRYRMALISPGYTTVENKD